MPDDTDDTEILFKPYSLDDAYGVIEANPRSSIEELLGAAMRANKGQQDPMRVKAILERALHERAHGGTYKCERCQGTFTKAVSEDEARAEELAEFGSNREDAALVCEPCFDAIERETVMAEEEAKRKEHANVIFSRLERAAALAVVMKTADKPATIPELCEMAQEDPDLRKLSDRNLRDLLGSVRRELYAQRSLS